VFGVFLASRRNPSKKILQRAQSFASGDPANEPFDPIIKKKKIQNEISDLVSQNQVIGEKLLKIEDLTGRQKSLLQHQKEKIFAQKSRLEKEHRLCLEGDMEFELAKGLLQDQIKKRGQNQLCLLEEKSALEKRLKEIAEEADHQELLNKKRATIKAEKNELVRDKTRTQRHCAKLTNQIAQLKTQFREIMASRNKDQVEEQKQPQRADSVRSLSRSLVEHLEDVELSEEEHYVKPPSLHEAWGLDITDEEDNRNWI